MKFKWRVPLKRHLWRELEALFAMNGRPPDGLLSRRISAFLAAVLSLDGCGV